LRSVTPYNYRKPVDKEEFYKKYKSEVDHVMKVADVDSDGMVSFNEFFFFVLIANIPSKYIESSFKKNGGKMTADKLAKAIEFHRKKILFGQNLKLTKEQKEDYMETVKGMVKNIYDGKQELTFSEWMEFRNEL